MKKLILIFIWLSAFLLNAQEQKISKISLKNKLLKVKNNTGDINAYFSKKEQQSLKNYFKKENQQKNINTECNQEQFSNNLDLASFISEDEGILTANDFYVAPNTQIAINTIKINLFVEDGGIDNVDLIFRNDNFIGPGTIITTLSNVIPTSRHLISENVLFGEIDLYQYVFDLTTMPVILDSNEFNTKFWFQIIARPNIAEESAYWENTDINRIGSKAFSLDTSNFYHNWFPTFQNLDGVFELSSTCTSLSTISSAYTVNNENAKFGKINIDNPVSLNQISNSPTINFENAGAISTIQSSNAYVLDELGDFYRINLDRGIYVFLGNIPPISSNWTGLEFDSTTDILYAVSNNSLATIDINTLTATLIGVTGLNAMASIAINGNGDIYTFDINDDNFYSLNKNTGTATLIGSIGFDASFGQGMAWDYNTNTIYISAFNNTLFESQWRSVNITTGETTLIGLLDTNYSDNQHAWVSIKGEENTPNCTGVYSTHQNLNEYQINGDSTINFDCENSPFLVPLEILETGIIGDNITFDSMQIFIDHVASSDMTISLISPSGTELVLADNIGGGIYNSYRGTIFNDNAPNITNAIFPFGVGPYSPEFGNFNTFFNGEDITGIWYLSICDDIFHTDYNGKDDGVVKLFSINFCKDDTTNGLLENSLTSILFYPNPTNDKLNFISNDKVESFEVYNYLGKKTNNFSIYSNYLDLSNLDLGVYILKYKINDKTESYIMVKN